MKTPAPRTFSLSSFLPRRLSPRQPTLTIRFLPTLLWAVCTLAAPAQQLQLVSQLDNTNLYSASGNGDSVLPVLSSDGRFVAFASTADNLCVLRETNRIRSLISPSMNVYLKDRQSGSTTLVSINQVGTGGGNGNSWPVAISTNGQHVLFESAASDLVTSDTNKANDVFLRDVVAGKTTLISVGTNGSSGNRGSRSPSMTPDARSIAFVSEANNLVSKDTNSIADVFVRDVQAGTTLLASPGARSTNPTIPSGSSEAPELSADGRYVAFYSTATNVVAGIRTAGEVYVRDTIDENTIFASTGSRSAMFTVTGASNNVVSFNHALSRDGRFVAYETATNSASRGLILKFDLASQTTAIVATNASVPAAALEDIHNLDITADGRFLAFVATSNYLTTVTTSVLLWDSEQAATALVSGDTNSLVTAGFLCDSPGVNENGRHVVFISNADLTGATGPDAYHVYLRDTQSGTTTLIDTAAGASSAGGITPAATPRLSADGRFVAFESNLPELSESDRNRSFDVFLRDTQTHSVELISSTLPTLVSQTPNGISSLAPLSISASGQYVAFSSEADNLVINDTNAASDIFVRGMLTRSNLLVSVSTNGLSVGNGISVDPAITSDGRYVAFASFANDLIPGDTNRFMDVFLRDVQAGSTILASITADGIRLGDGDSYSPILSSDGRFVLFRSRARNMVGGVGTTAVYGNLLLRDLQNNTNYALTTSGVFDVSATPDCRRVAYIARPGSTPGPLYVWDTLAAARIYTNTGTIVSATISPDGKRVAYWLGSSTPSLYVANIPDGTSTLLGTGSQAPSAKSVRFSGDGRLLAYLLPLEGTNQVFLYDTHTATQTLVTRSYDAAGAGNGVSDSVDITTDGRFITCRSSASNLVPVDTNNVPDVFLYDVSTGTTTLLSINQAGSSTADNHSLRPLFSADSRMLFYQSWATDLAGGDMNLSSDIYAWTLYSSGIIPFFSAQLALGESGMGVVITWPVVPGKSYSVQYKNSFDDPDWRDAGHGVLVGSQGWFRDETAPAQRFYRVVAY
jgi:Tol biopolymer transport system component